jgi:hypothetical protein
MVLSSLLAFAILPVMVMLRPQQSSRRFVVLIESAALGALTYVLFNPFLVINLIWNRSVLRSNLGNSTAMYQVSGSGFANALRLIVLSASPAVVVGAAIGFLLLAWRRARSRSTPGQSTASCLGAGAAHVLLAAPAILVTIQFLLLATNKPPEYARFALLIDVLLLVTTMAAIGRLNSTRARHVLAMALLAFTLPFALPYVAGFVRDASPRPSRLIAAERLKDLLDQGTATSLELSAEPAPYCMPPLDLFRTRLILPPTGGSAAADVSLRLNPAGTRAPISWADVRFAIVPRRAATTAVSSPP